MSKHLVSVYGTLRKGYGNNRLLTSSPLITTGKTADKMVMHAAGIPYVSRTQEVSKITVEVYEVDDVTLSRLDGLEGHPRFYKRELTKIDGDDGVTREAWLYYCNGHGTVVESGDYSDYRKKY